MITGKGSMHVRFTYNTNHMPTYFGDRVALSTIESGWYQEGWGVSRGVSVRNFKKQIRLTYSLLRAMFERAVTSTREEHRSLYIDLEEEDFKPMALPDKYEHRCEVCSTKKLKAPKVICDKCEELSKESRDLVRAVQPTVVISVDDKWRWVTGHISLAME